MSIIGHQGNRVDVPAERHVHPPVGLVPAGASEGGRGDCRESSGLAGSLPVADHELAARYCWETNTNYDAVKLMLDAGFPVAHPERSHGYSPLHNAAWAGSADLVDLLIERGHPVDLRDPAFHATPLGFAIRCCTVARRHPEGEYGRVARSLPAAGCPVDDEMAPTGDRAIDEAIRTHQ